jgi:HrpA-like RNA helicase
MFCILEDRVFLVEPHAASLPICTQPRSLAAVAMEMVLSAELTVHLCSETK